MYKLVISHVIKYGLISTPLLALLILGNINATDRRSYLDRFIPINVSTNTVADEFPEIEREKSSEDQEQQEEVKSIQATMLKLSQNNDNEIDASKMLYKKKETRRLTTLSEVLCQKLKMFLKEDNVNIEEIVDTSDKMVKTIIEASQKSRE